jgi:hypothetical protein
MITCSTPRTSAVSLWFISVCPGRAMFALKLSRPSWDNGCWCGGDGLAVGPADYSGVPKGGIVASRKNIIRFAQSGLLFCDIPRHLTARMTSRINLPRATQLST